MQVYRRLMADRDYPDPVYKKGFQQNYGIALEG